MRLMEGTQSQYVHAVHRLFFDSGFVKAIRNMTREDQIIPLIYSCKDLHTAFGGVPFLDVSL